MSSTFGKRPFVQNTYTDNFTRGYAGQLVSEQDYISNVLETFATEAPLFMGRACAIGTIQTQDSNAPQVLTSPFTIITTQGVVSAANLVGVVIRPYITTTNLVNEQGDDWAGHNAKEQAAVLPFGSDKRVLVSLKAGLAAVYNAAVYVATDATNPDNINVGEFGVTAGAGALLVPNAIWYETKTATVDDAIAVIRLK